MSTDTIFQIKSSSPEDTSRLGEQLGKRCKGGEVFLLVSDLGGGKTTFTKGLAKGLGSEDSVGSPTFTVSRVYDCRDNIKLYHFDFYRLNDGGVVAHELAETMDDPKAVSVIEWGGIVDNVLPQDHVTINFERQKSGEDDRLIAVNVSHNLKYLAEGIQS